MQIYYEDEEKQFEINENYPEYFESETEGYWEYTSDDIGKVYEFAVKVVISNDEDYSRIYDVFVAEYDGEYKVLFCE